MVRIIMIGEAHNSALAPRMVLENLQDLHKRKVSVVVASEDEGSLQAKTDLRQHIRTMNVLKSALAKIDHKLVGKICNGGDDIALSQNEIESLKKFCKSEEVKKILQDAAPEFSAEIQSRHGYKFLVEQLGSMELLAANSGGIERIEPYAQLFEEVAAHSIKCVPLEDKTKTMARYLELKDKLDEGEITEDEMQEMVDIAQDPEVEKRRIFTMSESVMKEASELRDKDDVVIYIYPIGMSHIQAMVANLEEMAAQQGVNLQISPYYLWDSREQKDKFFLENPEVSPDSLEGKIAMPHLFLSEDDHRKKYLEEFERFTKSALPQSPKSASVEQVVDHNKSNVSTVG